MIFGYPRQCPHCDIPGPYEDHEWCQMMQKRLQDYCPPLNWKEYFEERWAYWKSIKPDTLIGDRESNNHLIRLGWRIPEGGLECLGIEDNYYN